MNWKDAEKVISSRLDAPLKNEANIFLVETKGIDVHNAAAKKTEKLIKSGIVSTFDCSISGIKSVGISRVTVFPIIGIAFLMIFIFTFNSQKLLINQRKADISILKAIGWKSSIIFYQILMESSILAIIGSISGTIAGYFSFFIFKPIFFGSRLLSLDLGATIRICGLSVIMFLFLAIITASFSKKSLSKIDLKIVK